MSTRRRKATEEEAERVNNRVRGIDVIVNMIYGQLNMTGYMISMVDKYLQGCGMEYKHKEKMLFNELKQTVTHMRFVNQQMSQPMFDLGVFNRILEDSNTQMRIMLYLLDRTAGNKELLDEYEKKLAEQPTMGIIGQDIIDKFKPQTL